MPGPLKPGGFPNVRFGDVPVLALLAAAALLGYVSLNREDRAPVMPVLAPPPSPAPVADPAPAPAPAAKTPLAAAPVEEVVSTPTAPPPTEPMAEPVTAAAVLGSLRAALAGVRCADLRVELVDDALNVSGTVTSIDDRSRVQQLVDALPAGLARTSTVAVASSALCEPLLLLDTQRTANMARGMPLTVGIVPGDGVLTGGQDLVLDIRAADAAHVQVDYFTVDGGVVHLLPNPLEPSAQLEAGATRRLGDRGGQARFWTIGPPFGHELIVVMVSGAPLFPVLRPEAEPAAAYLSELKRALTEPGTEGALAAALFIATQAP